jgi:hypothetical protein
VGALAFGSTAATADTFYNTIDATVDAAPEVLNLATGGVPVGVPILLQIDGHQAGDHPNCNLNGDPHFVQLELANSTPAVASAAFAGGNDTFSSCDDELTVTVTPLTVGTTTITFSELLSDLSNDPHLKFSYAEASFTVAVVDGTVDQHETTCDANPAAPAWAAALLKGNGVKSKPNGRNYVSEVAQHMTQRAEFDGVVKNAPDLAYADAVWSYMTTTQLLILPKGPGDVAKPGWECTAVS